MTLPAWAPLIPGGVWLPPPEPEPVAQRQAGTVVLFPPWTWPRVAVRRYPQPPVMPRLSSWPLPPQPPQPPRPPARPRPQPSAALTAHLGGRPPAITLALPGPAVLDVTLPGPAVLDVKAPARLVMLARSPRHGGR